MTAQPPVSLLAVNWDYLGNEPLLHGFVSKCYLEIHVVATP